LSNHRRVSESSGSPHHDFYISYPRGEKEFARALFEALRYRGASAFIDFDALKGGQDLSELFLDALRSSKIVAVLVSQHSAQARFQRDEINQAVALERVGPLPRRVVPVALDAEGQAYSRELPVLSGRVWLSASDPEAAAKQLLEILNLDGKGPQGAKVDPPAPSPTYPSWLEAVAIVYGPEGAPGCACLVAPDKAITVAHLFRDDHGAQFLLSFPWSTNHDQRFVVKGVELDHRRDVAILDLSTVEHVVPLPIAHDVTPRAPYLLAVPNPRVPKARVSMERGHIAGTVRRTFVNHGGDMLDLGPLSAPPPAGSSGAPVVVGGEVVGLFAAAETSAEPRGFAVPVRPLARPAVAPSASTPPPPPPPPPPTPPPQHP
jgi:hypothetical protein